MSWTEGLVVHSDALAGRLLFLSGMLVTSTHSFWTTGSHDQTAHPKDYIRKP
jgi:hypothetical protein